MTFVTLHQLETVLDSVLDSNSSQAIGDLIARRVIVDLVQIRTILQKICWTKVAFSGSLLMIPGVLARRAHRHLVSDNLSRVDGQDSLRRVVQLSRSFSLTSCIS